MTEIPRVQARPARLKRCGRCGDWWPASCYNRNRASPDGLESRCKACRAEERQTQKWRRVGSYRGTLRVAAHYHVCPRCGQPCGLVKVGTRKGRLGYHRRGGKPCPGMETLWADAKPRRRR